MQILRPVIALLAVVCIASSVSAQRMPWIQLDLGALGMHERVPTEFHGSSARTTSDIGVGVAVGVPVTTWFIPDVSFHSSVGRDLPYHSLSLGLAARTRDARRLYAHAALVYMFASQSAACASGCAQGPNGNDRRWGMEIRTGMNLKDPQQFTLGPTLWYQQSFSPTGTLLTTYKTFGLGLQVGFY